jgi:hypothetical protein
MVKRFNGYYDHTNSVSNYFQYLDLLRASYVATRQMALVDSKLLTLYFPGNLNALHRLDTIKYENGFRLLIDQISSSKMDWIAYPYTFYQTIMGRLNLFRVLEGCLSGLRVAVVSPFSRSIEENWKNRTKLFKDFDYPDFTLITLNSPITYDGLPRDMYPDETWFETLETLKTQLSTLDFDIALLSCGSYAMPLGLHARDKLGRKAIYVGGILQLFFGIMGRRYQNSFFLDFINAEYFIAPLEREDFFKHVTVSSDTATEAFGAYF